MLQENIVKQIYLEFHGVLYKEILTTKDKFTFTTQTDIEGIIINNIEPILSGKKIRNYYSSEYPEVDTADLAITWNPKH